MTQDSQTTSTRPYFVRALHEWCSDNGLTPYVTVMVDNTVQVPREYVKDGEIVLNIGFDATTGLTLGNDYLEFKARFAGVVRDIMVPIHQVVAIFAKENGQGMAFPRLELAGGKSDVSQRVRPLKPAVARLAPVDGSIAQEAESASTTASPAPKSGTRPSLTLIK